MDCYGYHGKILHVDLSARRACIEHAERKGFGDILRLDHYLEWTVEEGHAERA